MQSAPKFPASRYAPSPWVDLTSKSERERLGPGAVRAFFNIMAVWKVRDEDARALLGGLSNGPYYRWKKQAPRLVATDVLQRISYLVGIFKALNILHDAPLADKWVHLPNRNMMFDGATPLDTMRRGGLPALQMVRRLLDARRGGL